MSDPLASRQNSLHADLDHFVAGGALARGRILARLSPRARPGPDATALVARYRAFRQALPANATASAQAPVAIEVPAYAGNNAHVHRLMAGLAPLAPWLAGAYAHGSTGTGEETPYSDLDALVILSDRAFESPRTLSRIAGSLAALQRIMFEFDPLQHHGWFVLTAADLDWYCDAYFPAELYRQARSLLPGPGNIVRLTPRESKAEIRRAFATLATMTSREIEGGRVPTDAYRLKGTLSRILLLPCLYLQARHGQGIFKRESFAAAARELPADVWAAMDEVSALRAAWVFAPTAWQRFLLTRTLVTRRLVARSLGTPVPPAVRGRLTPEFWQGVLHLVRAMETAVDA